MQSFETFPADAARALCYVLHDIDDTITDEGKLRPEAYAALWALHEAGLAVVPVTGRPAGWCDMILRQWPVDAVIGENGALVFYWGGGQVRRFLHPSIPKESVQEQLAAVTRACLQGVPGCRVARDQFARLYDVAIDFAEDPPRLPLSDAERIRDIAASLGATAKISSIHVNFWFGAYDKCSMARLFFEQVWNLPDLSARGIFFGDSPNDEPMFRMFPMSCAVANIAPFLSQLAHPPAFVTAQPGGRGFAEAAAHILTARASSK